MLSSNSGHLFGPLFGQAFVRNLSCKLKLYQAEAWTNRFLVWSNSNWEEIGWYILVGGFHLAVQVPGSTGYPNIGLEPYVL